MRKSGRCRKWWQMDFETRIPETAMLLLLSCWYPHAALILDACGHPLKAGLHLSGWIMLLASGSSGSCERQKKQLCSSLARLSGIQGEIGEKKEPLFLIGRWESARLVCTIYNTMAGSWLLPTGSRWPTTVFLSTRLHLSGRMLASAGVVRE